MALLPTHWQVRCAPALVGLVCIAGLLGPIAAAPAARAAASGPAVIGSVEVPGEPTAVAVGPLGDRVYVSSGLALMAVDAPTLQVAWSTPVKSGAVDVAVAPAGSPVYVVGGRRATAIDAATGRILRSFALPYGADAIAVTPDGSQLWVLSSEPKGRSTAGDGSGKDSGVVTVLSASTGKVVDRISVGPIPTDLVMSPSGARAYVLGWASNSIWILNAKSRSVVSKVKVRSWPQAMALNPDGSRLLVSHSPPGPQSSYAVTTLNTERRDVAGVFRFPADLSGLAFNQSDVQIGDTWLGAGKALFGVDVRNGSLDGRPGLLVIDLTTQRAVSTVAITPACRGVVGQAGLALAPDATRAYVITDCLGGPGALTAVGLTQGADPS